MHVADYQGYYGNNQVTNEKHSFFSFFQQDSIGILFNFTSADINTYKQLKMKDKQKELESSKVLGGFHTQAKMRTGKKQ